MSHLFCLFPVSYCNNATMQKLTEKIECAHYQKPTYQLPVSHSVDLELCPSQSAKCRDKFYIGPPSQGHFVTHFLFSPQLLMSALATLSACEHILQCICSTASKAAA